MAEPYYSKLRQILESLNLPGKNLECKHFFGGAALYANEKIFASYSPAGIAVKLPEEKRKQLIREGKARQFRFFPQGPIKKEYVLLGEQFLDVEHGLLDFLRESIRYV